MPDNIDKITREALRLIQEKPYDVEAFGEMRDTLYEASDLYNIEPVRMQATEEIIHAIVDSWGETKH